MSSTGNRSNPNQTRTAGHQGQPLQPAQADPGGTPGADRQGTTHQESRDHNKHTDGGQTGHKPQPHKPAEEKH